MPVVFNSAVWVVTYERQEKATLSAAVRVHMTSQTHTDEL